MHATAPRDNPRPPKGFGNGIWECLWPFCERDGRNPGRFFPHQTAITPWIRGESRPREASSAHFFLGVWGLPGICRGFVGMLQNDAATIALGFRPKMQLGLRMRQSAIGAVTGNDAE